LHLPPHRDRVDVDELEDLEDPLDDDDQYTWP
jgi:hypothetical protein